jgi:hypothetical protein
MSFQQDKNYHINKASGNTAANAIQKPYSKDGIPAVEYVFMTIIFVMDAIILLRAYQYVQRQIVNGHYHAQQQQANNEQEGQGREHANEQQERHAGQHDGVFLYGHYARQLDLYLMGADCNDENQSALPSSPSTTSTSPPQQQQQRVLPTLLLLGACLCLSLAMGSAAIHSYLVWFQTMTSCDAYLLQPPQPKTNENDASSSVMIPGIPPELQKWAKGQVPSSPQKMARLVDGTVFMISAELPPPDGAGNYSEFAHHPAVLAACFPNMTNVFYHHAMEPRTFTNIRGVDLLHSQLFCGIFRHADDDEIRKVVWKRDSVFCAGIQDGDDDKAQLQQQHHGMVTLRYVTINDDTAGGEALTNFVSMAVFEDKVWLSSREYSGGILWRFYTLDPVLDDKLTFVKNYSDSYEETAGVVMEERENRRFWKNYYPKFASPGFAECYARAHITGMATMGIALVGAATAWWIHPSPQMSQVTAPAALVWLGLLALLTVTFSQDAMEIFLSRGEFEPGTLPYWFVMSTFVACGMALCVSGVWTPSPRLRRRCSHLKREHLVWLYVASSCTMDYCVMQTLGRFALQIGFDALMCLILNFPALQFDALWSFLFVVTLTIFYAFQGNFTNALGNVLMQSVMCVGAVTFGYFLQSYRRFIVYHLVRIYKSRVGMYCRRQRRRHGQNPEDDNTGGVALVQTGSI